MNKKLNSFTLSEMLVVLIITAIVVGLAFSVLSIVRRQVHKLQNDTDQRVQYDMLKSKLFLDFNKYPNAYLSGDDTFMFKSEIDSTIYIIKDNQIVSNQDTLIKNVKEAQFFYKNSQVEKGKIDAIKFIIEEKREVFKSIFVYKYNDATDINDIESNGI
jgi:type II secretory pathway pseudopilin PulG